MNGDRVDELRALVADSMDDIIFDHVNYDRPVKIEIKTKELETLDAGIDDGAVYGTYRIVVNGGAFIITLGASGWFQSFQDCWDAASESHYTKDIICDELQDFETHVIKFIEDNGQALDKAIETDREAL